MAAAASAFSQEGAFSFNPYGGPPLNIGERVVWLGNDEPEHGTVRWMGILLDISKDWTAGVELDNPVGSMDGKWGGKKLFDCKPRHGMVIALHGLIKEEDFGDGFELVSPPPSDDVLTNDMAGSSLTNGYKTDVASTDQKQEIRASENEGDKYIEKFLAAQSTPRTGASSFDRRVYAHMFAECEVEKWYEVLDYPQDAACGSLDVGFEKSRKKKDSLLSEPKDTTLCRNGEYVESKKKERGGIFRFFRWLRRSRSSKALDSSTRRTRSAMRVSDFQRVKTKSLESVTSLSESFHYIPVGVRCSEDGAERESKECFYEDLEPGLQLAPKLVAAKLKCSSMSRVSCDELEKHKRGMAYEAHRPRSVRSACSPNMASSSLSRKKRRAPLPPALGTPAGRRSAVGPRSHWTRVLPEAASSTSRLSNGDVALSHLGDLNRKIASSTGAIYKDPSKISARADPKPLESTHKRSASLTANDVPKVPASPQRVGSHIKNKRKAPPPPMPAQSEPLTRPSKGIQTEPENPPKPSGGDPAEHQDASLEVNTADKNVEGEIVNQMDVGGPLQATEEPIPPTEEPPPTTEESRLTNEEAPLITKVPLLITKEHQSTTQVPLPTTREHPQAIKENPQAIQEHPQAIKEHPQAIKEHPQAIKEHPHAINEQPLASKEHLQGTKEPLQETTRAEAEFFEERTAAADVTKNDEDTPPELPKKQKCRKTQQVEAESGAGAALGQAKPRTGLVFVNHGSEQAPEAAESSSPKDNDARGKPVRQSSKVSSSSDSSPIIVKLKELRIVEDEGQPKAEAQMNIQALQELVETLVDQYCGNPKPGDSVADEHRTSDAEDPEAMLERQLEDDLSEAVARNYGGAARRSMSIGSNASSGWGPEDKISNLDADNTGTTNSSTTTTTTSASEDVDNDDQLAGRLLERWQARMREQMINMDLNLPEKQRRSKKVLVRSQSASEEDNNAGIYEPIGNFLQRGSAVLEEPSSSKRYSREEQDHEEDGSLHQAESRRGSKRSSGFQGTFSAENPDDNEQKDPFLFWRDLCARKYADGGEQLQASEKLIRRLSVNGQRQPVKKDDQDPEPVEDKARIVAATPKNSGFQTGREAQHQDYENVFTATPHRMVVVDGLSAQGPYENCSPYWAPAPYGPALQRRYPVPPYQAITVMPFMAPPVPHIYADPRFHPGGFLAPAYGGYVYSAHPDLQAPMQARLASRQAEKRGTGRTPADRSSDSPLQEECDHSWSKPKTSAAAIRAPGSSSAVCEDARDVADEDGSEGKKNRGAVLKASAAGRAAQKANVGKTADSGKISQQLVVETELEKSSHKIAQQKESAAGRTDQKADIGKTAPIADSDRIARQLGETQPGKSARQSIVPKTSAAGKPAPIADRSKIAQQPVAETELDKSSRQSTIPKASAAAKTVQKESAAGRTVQKAEATKIVLAKDSGKRSQQTDVEAESDKSSTSRTAVTEGSGKILQQAIAETEPDRSCRQSTIPKARAKSRSLDRHSYANVPPSPPPRGSSSGRSSRLAANCDWLKEKSKSVEAKIKAARGENADRAGPPRARPQSDNPKLQARSAVPVPVPKPRKCDAKEKPPAHPAKPQDPSPAEAAKSRPNLSSSVVIGGIKVPTPLNLWPLEYELIAPELRRLKARMEGKAVDEDAEPDDCDPSDVDKLAVDRLLKQLEIAIGTGKLDEAATLARDLAQLKIQCLVVRNRDPAGDGQQMPIILNMFVEDKISHHGPIPIRVLPSITVGELKTKIFQEFEFPTVIQRWILGKQLVMDDGLSISSFGVNADGCPVFLYLLSLEDLRVKAKDLVWDDNISPKVTGARAKSSPPARASRAKKPAAKKVKQPTVQEQEPEIPDVTESNDEVGGTRLLGWSCEICTLVNIPTRPGCAMCGNERPVDYVVPEQYRLRESELERMEREKEQERAIKEVEEHQRLQNWQNYLKLEDQDVIYNEVAFECSICFTEALPGQGVKLRDCLHSFCSDCLRHAVTHSEAATVICPFRDENYSCDSVLQEREIRALVPPDVFERYLQRSMKTAESQAPNSFHCKTPDCLGWCLIEDNANEFLCPVCSHLNCITCRAIHQELNCKQYQDKLTVLARTDDEAKKTKDAIDVMLRRGEAMNCPNCQVIIMKKWGCDWLCCSVCKTEICWVTKGPRWGPNGRGDLSAGCKCGTNGVRCHPNCTYCH